ncbi:hypothetical protein NDA11_001008 [Ustilago hordei]|uniref:Uncharacterized protein n=1 Tax=Ustilago hordei TaxID=120017 RepID=I2G267_USTHO|nr:uncharacterized protein UHO2_02581 [Ustilago hordei]KAJ1040253.1 hypothetical protein NDA10_007870 [Ustilago hordei]KAJ1585232.1 hypothetical protein NDA15_004281 [Ustilago hordei]KAJ1587730.1 hypothetical protein NDA12_000100 [Ustilago hordei]KAJ1592715.1 hypothetical protein NDA11_001008 [Ustilago hordei]UTT93962.1 hypothetical protein NDA17_006025 [Ustilago hordei]
METKTPLRAVDIFAAHLLTQLQHHRSRFTSSTTPPLFVAMQGPQGSGKTTVTRSLISHLSSTGLKVGVLSTDDLYHTYANLKRVAEENPNNPLLSGRGQPGTHDVSLGVEILGQAYRINEEGGEVRLPVFDKSLYNGYGDRARSSQSPVLKGPLDIFILEGWSMGFSPIPSSLVSEKQKSCPPDAPLKRYTLESLQQINTNLTTYTEWYNPFTVFLQIQPTDINNVYIWRTQQEHHMKASNGGKGMTDDEVRRFVDRYMPGYHLFLDTIREDARWKGRSKTVTIDLERSVVGVEDW